MVPGVDSVMGDGNNNNREVVGEVGVMRGNNADRTICQGQAMVARGKWGTDQMVGEGIATEIRERARMMNRETTMIIDNKNNNDYLRNNIAREPILNGGQSKRVFDSTQRYQRRWQTARKMKELSVTCDGSVYKRSSKLIHRGASATSRGRR